MVCIVILGRQGSGKGTQSTLIEQKYGCLHVSTGDMLRSAVSARSELGIKAEALMLSGQLISNEIAVGIVAERLQHEDAIKATGVLLDGFPRNLEQAEALEALLAAEGRSITLAVNLEVPVEVAVERLLARGRSDDTEESIARRLKDYEIQTMPLLQWFEQRNLLFSVDGLGVVEDVFYRVASVIDDALDVACQQAAAHNKQTKRQSRC